MKQKFFDSLLTKKVVAIISVALVVLTFLLSSFKANKAYDDMWKMLGITKQSGDDKIKTSFISGYLYYYGVKNIKNIAVNDRAAVAKDLLTYTKQYIGSPTFAREYADMRKNSRPVEPILKSPRTVEEIQKEEIAKTEKSIKDTEKNMKDMPQYAKSMEPVLQILKDNLKKFQDPKNSYFSSIAMGEKNDQDRALNSYKESVKRWDLAYPENVNQFVITRLQTMLEVTKDIDYNAELVEKFGKKRFVNPAYESKRAEWKQGFRAGKDVTEAARAFAQQWLRELEK